MEEKVKGSSESAAQNSDKLQKLEASKTELQKALIEAKETISSLKQTALDRQSVQSELEVQQRRAQSAEVNFEQQKERAQQFEQELNLAKQEQQKLKEELEVIKKEASTPSVQPSAASASTVGYPVRVDIEELPKPENATAFFDLNYYWTAQGEEATLSSSLHELLTELESLIDKGDKAVESEKLPALVATSQSLMKLARSINSDALVDLAQSLENDCRQGLLDNALIRWYPTKTGLQKSLRVVYEQLQRI